MAARMNSPSALGYIDIVTVGISGLLTATANLFLGFHDLMGKIMPKLTENEQNQVHDAIDEYQKFLMTSQTFLTRTRLRVEDARTEEDFLKAIDAQTLSVLCDQCTPLQSKFRKISVFVQAKTQDERINEKWGKVALGVAVGAACVLLIASGVGAAVGFGVALTYVTEIAGATAGIGLVTAIGAKVARDNNVFDQVLANLQELKKILTKMSQHYANMRGYQDGLNPGRRDEFLALLRKANEQVSQGFDILATF